VNQNDFSFSRIGVLNPRSVQWLILFSLHNAKHAKDEFLSMLTLLPVVLLILFVFPYLLLFNEIEIKQSPISFHSVLPPPLAIILLKPRALSNAISNRTDWCFRKQGQLRLTSVARTHFMVLFKGKLTVLLPLFRFGFQRIINWTVLFQQYHA